MTTLYEAVNDSWVLSEMDALLGLLSIGAVTIAGTPAQAEPAEVTVVDFVDLNRYLGKWDEIAGSDVVSERLHCIHSRRCFAARR